MTTKPLGITDKTLLEFSKRLHVALTDEDIFDGDFHAGQAYIQRKGTRRKRVLVPVMAFLKDGPDYSDLALCVYFASDGTFFGEHNVGVHIDGAPNPDLSLHVNPKWLHLIS